MTTQQHTCLNVRERTACQGSVIRCYDADGRTQWRCMAHQIEHLHHQLKRLEGWLRSDLLWQEQLARKAQERAAQQTREREREAEAHAHAEAEAQVMPS